MTWGMIGGAAISVVGGSLMNKGSSSSGGGAASGNSPAYVPTGLGATDQSWQNMFGASNDLATRTGLETQPYYNQSLQNQNNINYTPYKDAGQNSANAYNYAGNMGVAQAQNYNNMAGVAQNQQGTMYSYGNQVMQNAMDPQSALYGRNSQQLTDQIRAGQAARGLGTSAVGGMEEAQAMGDFNLGWQDRQLARQAQGLQAASGASAAGAQQGQLYGAYQNAALSGLGQAGQYYGQGGQNYLTSQQTMAGAPGTAAATYTQQMANQQNLYGTAMNGAQSYMGMGSANQMSNYNANNAQNSAMATGLGQIAGAAIPAAVNWWNQPSQGSGVGQKSSTDNQNIYSDYGYGA